MTRIDWNQRALDELMQRPETGQFIEKAATKVRNQARDNAKSHYPSTKRSTAIAVDSGRDDESVYSDVGYTKTHPGFVLWWSEVGTQQMSPRPHLRAALNQVRL